MFEVIKSGGWLMYPLLLCSLASMTIIVERFWTLQRGRVIPRGVVAQVRNWIKNDKLDEQHLDSLRKSSPLGRILAAGLSNRYRRREQMKESIEEVGGQVVHELGRYLNTLGTIAAISPLLGLLGTVLGMIDVFATITTEGIGNATALAGGISTALVTTATGLCIAIPSLLFYRHLRGRVETLVVAMEHEAVKMLDALEGSNVRTKNEFESNT